MTVSGPYGGDPTERAAESIAFYRRMLREHADEPTLGACPACIRHRCHAWALAWAALVAAGEQP